VIATSITLSGHIYDLYDFQFVVNTDPAVVQAGYPTLGQAGRIFWNDVDITGTRTLDVGLATEMDLCVDADGLYDHVCDALQP